LSKIVLLTGRVLGDTGRDGDDHVPGHDRHTMQRSNSVFPLFNSSGSWTSLSKSTPRPRTAATEMNAVDDDLFLFFGGSQAILNKRILPTGFWERLAGRRWNYWPCNLV
jgi:hypothetical protein